MTAALQGHRVARLAVLDCGLFSVRGGQRVIGIPAFVLETDRGARVLVDGGFPKAYWEDAGAAAVADGLGSFGALVGYGAAQTLPGQLARLGLTAAEIDLHILSHGHIDHVGGLALCRALMLTATERAAPAPRYFGSARPVAWPDVPTTLIDRETVVCEGLTLIPTPGHTPGHLSLRVDLPRHGTVILAGDAINRASEPDEGFPDAEDPALAAQSAAALFELQRRTGGLLIYGHDPAQWPDLPKAPEYWS